MIPTLVSINIGILGLGVVGSDLVNLLTEHHNELIRKTGYNVVIHKIAVLDVNKPRKCSINGITLTNNAYDVIQDPKIDIIIELIGGIDMPAQYIFAAISEGKHIITANKALIAEHGNKILSSAKEKNVVVVFEAAVCGGLPILKILREGLSGNKIRSIVGVLNGTGNYILTKMLDDGISFNCALEQAQKLGYAEANPNNDIQGIDSVQKLSILASIAFGTDVKYKDVHTEGISHINSLDLLCAKEMGCVIKHLAYAEKDNAYIRLHVHPTLISNIHKLAEIDGVMNGIMIEAEPVGHTFYYGAGAGGRATSSAIIADLIDIIRTINSPGSRDYLYSEFIASLNYLYESIEDLNFSYYVRIPCPLLESDIRVVANRYGIRIIKFEQVRNLTGIDDLSVILIIDRTIEKTMKHFILELHNDCVVDTSIITFRMHDHHFALQPKALPDFKDAQMKSLLNTEYA
ncbi:MAG: homoserine dehydrogenase [Gammaproteobacteria bacterium]